MVESDGVTAPAKGADDKPPAPISTPTWRIGPIAVATGLAVSVMVHLALLGTALFVGPLLGRPAPVYAVPVELVTAEQVAEEKPSAKAGKRDEPPKSDPQAQMQAQAEAQSRPPPPAGPASAASPALASPALPVDAFSLPQPPAPGRAAAPAPPSGQAEQLAKLIGLPVAGPNGGPSDYKADLTHDQIAAFAAHLQSCWASPAGIADDPNLYVVIRVNLRRDGSLAANPEVVAGSASMSALAIKHSAMNALEHCPAYGDLPGDKYDQWRLLDLRFTPSGISTATPVTGAQHASPRPG